MSECRWTAAVVMLISTMVLGVCGLRGSGIDLAAGAQGTRYCPSIEAKVGGHLAPHTRHLTHHTSHLASHTQRLTPRRYNASPAARTPCGWSARVSRTTSFTPTALGQPLYPCILALSLTAPTGTPIICFRGTLLRLADDCAQQRLS
jgi:hypothetical protein